MRRVPKSRVDPPGTRVWNKSATRPFEELISTAVLILGKYVLINCCTLEFKKREGIVIKRVAQVLGSVGSLQAKVVSVACSCAVIWLRMSFGTTGSAPGLTCEKSPVQSEGCGNLLLEKLTGSRS